MFGVTREYVVMIRLSEVAVINTIVDIKIIICSITTRSQSAAIVPISAGCTLPSSAPLMLNFTINGLIVFPVFTSVLTS